MWTIDVLGALVVRKDGELLPPLSPLPAAVLTCLALAGRKGMKTPELLDAVVHPNGGRAIASKSALHKHFETLHKLELPIPRFGSLVTDGYALEVDRVRVDAAEFVDGVRALPAEPTEAQVAKLIGYWREDPRAAQPRTRRNRWRPVFQARTTLVARIESAGLEGMAGLEEFVGLFPSDPECAPLRDRLARRERKRLLVVEDDVLEQIVVCLEADGYDCLPVGGLDDWHRLLKSDRDRILRCHGALVDLHLTEALNDEQGFDIVEWLRDNTEIPTALMTVAPPWDDLDLQPPLHRNRYRLVRIVNKQKGRRLNLPAIRAIAKALTSDEEEDVCARLSTWLESAYFHADRRLRRIRTRDGEKRVRECERSADAVRRTLSSSPLHEAEQAVRAFVDTWGRG
ncbi:hypothetical protein GCM10010187_12640 [Actinomadura coerulea]|nr:hypothetical protein GCM10010187_12640 [Actinomadura coerulea]